MDADLEKLLKAIQITDDKYGKGTTRWIAYLQNHDKNCFTSTNGARDLIVSLDFDHLRKKVFVQIFQNLIKYLEQDVIYTDNSVVNHIVKWISFEVLQNNDMSDEDILKLYEEFSVDFPSYESHFGNELVMNVLTGNFKKRKKGNHCFENFSVILTILKKFILIAEDHFEVVKPEEVTVNSEFVLASNDEDIVKFLNAIEITQSKYEKNQSFVQFAEYLETGNTMVFTASKGARDLVESMDWSILRLKVFIRVFENVLTYYQTDNVLKVPANMVVVNLVDRIVWEFENSDDVAQTFLESVDNYICNAKRNKESVSLALEVIRGTIKPDQQNGSLKLLESERQNICSYLEQLISYGKKTLEADIHLNA